MWIPCEMDGPAPRTTFCPCVHAGRLLRMGTWKRLAGWQVEATGRQEGQAAPQKEGRLRWESVGRFEVRTK